jgi:hypothetical protein
VQEPAANKIANNRSRRTAHIRVFLLFGSPPPDKVAPATTYLGGFHHDSATFACGVAFFAANEPASVAQDQRAGY